MGRSLITVLWQLLSKGFFCVQKRKEKENTVTKKEPQKGFFLVQGVKKMNLTIKKVYQVSSKGKEENPRLFLQHLVTEAAGFLPGDELYVNVNETTKEILIQNQPITGDDHKIHVASRMSKTMGIRRPLIDTCGETAALFQLSRR